ncbi:MAG: glucokinase [Planctomycetota bacterium]
MSDLLLVGDVGGTNVRLRVVRRDDTKASAMMEETYGQKRPIVDALADFIGKLSDPVVACCLGVAGRVVDHDVRMTNRPGEAITNEAVAEKLGLPPGRVTLVNDMVAHISGVDLCETVQLRGGKSEGDVEGIVMPGTGLGTGFRVMTPAGWFPVPSEGGHLDFGPPNASLDFVRDAFQDLLEIPLDGRLSWEQVCSGPALPMLYAVVTSPDAPTGVRQPDPKDVTTAATGGEVEGLDSSAAREAVRLFLHLVGARAGNLLLDTLATRRMIFGGGILNRLYDHDADLVTRLLAESFDATGPSALHDTLANTPLVLLRSDDSGIIGAAALARSLI